MPKPKEKMDKDKFARQFNSKLTRAEIAYARKLKKELNRVLDLVAANLEKWTEVEAAYKNEHTRQLTLLNFEASRSTLNSFVDLQAKDLDLPLQPGIYDRVYSEYIAGNTLELSKLKASTTFTDIKRRIVDLFNSGVLEQSALAAEILKVKKLTPARALLIARTETHNAATFAQEEVAKEYVSYYGKPLKKRWNPVLDKRVRPDHRAMARVKPIPLDALFSVGGSKMSRPGDPNGGANQVCNCRCLLTFDV